jgi:hypothetical protein
MTVSLIKPEWAYVKNLDRGGFQNSPGQPAPGWKWVKASAGVTAMAGDTGLQPVIPVKAGIHTQLGGYDNFDTHPAIWQPASADQILGRFQSADDPGQQVDEQVIVNRLGAQREIQAVAVIQMAVVGV